MGKELRKNNKLFKRLAAAMLGATIISAGAASVAFTFTWFTNQNELINQHINGHTAGAYFARGTGTKEDPYVINRPFHFYNLAWLQYMGYFPEGTYFIIETDLDMSGWTLPPIGTIDHPFIGHLNGYDTEHGKNQTHASIVSNITVTNDFSALQKHPTAVSSLNGANIVGVFGVIGEENKDYASSDAPSVKNVFFNNADVTDVEKSTLIGIAAGYVNGMMENVGISGSSKLNVPTGGGLSSFGGYTNNISDYTSVGYCDPDFRSNVYNKEVTVSASEPTNSEVSGGSEGSESGFGGSIDMNLMFSNLSSIWNNTQPIQAVTAESIEIDENGNVVSHEVTDTNSDRRSFSSINFYYANNQQTNSDGVVTASYSFAKRTDSDNYMTLYGRDTITSNTQKTITTTRPTKTPNLTIGNGSGRYLSVSRTTGYWGYNYSVADVTSNPYEWSIDADGYLSTKYNGSTTVYLNVSSGELAVSTSRNTTWTYDENAHTLSTSSGYYLQYDDGWTLFNGDNDYYLIYDNNSHYFNYNNSYTPTVGNSRDTATKWKYDPSIPAYITTNSDGETVYIGYYNSSYTLVVYTSGKAYYAVNGNRFSATYNGNTYYLRYNNSSWSTTTNSSQAARITVEHVVNTVTYPTIDATISSYNTGTATSTAKENSTYDTNVCYFPVSHENGIPDENNTGYVVSGAYNTNDTLGDIRVSRFTKGSSSTNGSLRNSGISANDNTLNDVRTINSSGDHVIGSSDSFELYDDTKTKFEAILAKDSSYIYGLHFMNASISMDHLIQVPYAKVNNIEYLNQNYELPEDSVDFSLKQKGYVNFFAGTYFVNGLGGVTNDSFFSFHEIERSGPSINSIREISKIWKNPNARPSQSYVYQYSNGTYSRPFLHGSRAGNKFELDGVTPYLGNTPTNAKPEGYSEQVFDTSWIKKQSSLSNYYAYYFEIPCNVGEYALGSVSNGTGAYLDYLDIGANSQMTYRSAFTEKKITDTYRYSYPKGVSFSFIDQSQIPGDSSSAPATEIVLPAVDAKNNADFSLTSSFAGTITVERTETGSGDSTVSSINYTSSNTNVITGYKDTKVTVVGNGETITSATGTLIESVTQRSIVYVDYSVFSESINQTEYRETTTTTYNEAGAGSTTTTKQVFVNGEDSTASVDWPVDLVIDESGCEAKATIDSFYLDGENVTVTVNAVYTEHFDDETGSHYQTITGYHVEVSADVDVEVVLVTLNDNTLTIQLKTGQDTYTTLEVNVPQIVSA